MAKEYKLEVEKRDSTKKSDLKKYRKEGFIPGVYYSFDSKENINFLVAQSEIKNAIKAEANIFAINVGGENRNVLFKSVQYHPVTESITHIDLYGVDMKKAVIVKVNLELVGDSVGIREEGGILNQTAQELEIKCLPLDIPNIIEVDISELSIGDTIQANQVKLDDKLELMSPEDMLIVSVTTPMKEAEPDTDEDIEAGAESDEGEAEASSDTGSDDSSGESSDSGNNS